MLSAYSGYGDLIWNHESLFAKNRHEGVITQLILDDRRVFSFHLRPSTLGLQESRRVGATGELAVLRSPQVTRRHDSSPLGSSEAFMDLTPPNELISMSTSYAKSHACNPIVSLHSYSDFPVSSHATL